MKIIIVGAGVIGSNLARVLSEEGHEVYLIESDKQQAQKVDEKFDVKVISGNGSDPESLKQAGVEQAGLVIAVTTSDETNLIVCSLAACYGAKRRIARVRNTSLSKAIRQLGFAQFHIDESINPEEVAAHTIVKMTETPGAREVADFANGQILLRSFDITKDSPLCALKLEELKEEDFPWPFLVVAILRNKSVLFPKGDSRIEAGDRIYVLLPFRSAGEFLTFVDPHVRHPQKVVIYGATNIGSRVAERLSSQIRDVSLLEESLSKAQEIAGQLKAVRVLNGSASEADVLRESGIEAADIFIATSENDHSNLISAVLAKKMGAKTTMITTQQPDYMTIMDSLAIDTVINPRLLAVDQILRWVRGAGISAVTKFEECDAEALELIPEEGSSVTKAMLKDIRFPKNSIIGAISRGTESILAKGNIQINPGEKVIVFCQDSAVKQLQKLFTARTFLS